MFGLLPHYDAICLDPLQRQTLDPSKILYGSRVHLVTDLVYLCCLKHVGLRAMSLNGGGQ